MEYFPGEQDDGNNSVDDDSLSDSSIDEEDDENKMHQGSVYSFGYGYFGQLGLGNGESVAIPQQIKELQNIIAVACGEAHSIAITAQGQVYSWGCNRYGQLGLGDTTHRSTPVLIDAIKSVKMKQAACGTNHTLLLTRNGGEVYSFGCGSFGRLGHGDHKHQMIPKPVSAMRGKLVVKVAAAGWFSACLSDQGAVYSWGCNRFGQLGHGKIPVQLFPRHVTGLYGKNIVKLVCGKHHMLVSTDKDECFAIGAGMCGQLGNRNKKHSFSPTVVDLPKKPILSLACGNLQSLALNTSGQILAWGYVTDDHLGLSENGEEYHAAPMPVSFDSNAKIVKLFAGGWHSAVISDKGDLYMWGFSYKGRLGNGKMDEDAKHPTSPTKVETMADNTVYSVACGGAHSLVIAVPRNTTKSS